MVIVVLCMDLCRIYRYRTFYKSVTLYDTDACKTLYYEVFKMKLEFGSEE